MTDNVVPLRPERNVTDLVIADLDRLRHPSYRPSVGPMGAYEEILAYCVHLRAEMSGYG